MSVKVKERSIDVEVKSRISYLNKIIKLELSSKNNYTSHRFEQLLNSMQVKKNKSSDKK